MQRAFGIGTGVKRGYAVDLQSNMGGRKGCRMLDGMDADLQCSSASAQGSKAHWKDGGTAP